MGRRGNCLYSNLRHMPKMNVLLQPTVPALPTPHEDLRDVTYLLTALPTL